MNGSARQLPISVATRSAPTSGSSCRSASSSRKPTPLVVLRELASHGGEQRRDLGVRLLDRAGEELEHAGAIVGQRDRKGRGGRQAGALGVSVAREAPVRGDVGDP